MVLHIACFGCVLCSGVLLATLSGILLRPDNGVISELLYILLDCIICLVFLAEVPFLYIINLLVSRSL